VANDRAEPSEATESCPRPRGRPLDAGRQGAILEATVKLLGQRGFDRFTVQDIADGAGVGLGTIYRRWPTKLDAVIAAVRLLDDDVPAATPTGDVEADLAQALIADVHNLAGCLGAVIPGLISAMPHDPDLARLLRDTAVAPKLDTFRQILAPMFPNPTERDLRAEMAVAIPFFRLLVTGQLPTEAEIRTELVPLILGRPLDIPQPPTKRAPARRSR
jgi:AcrR family transcriptional regulator